MKSKAARLVRRNHARYHQGRDDLNIVPMIDMMVILVFFLIFTAVFSKTNILQLNLPATNTAPVELPKGLKLEVIIRPNDLVVNDRNSGPLKVIANSRSDRREIADVLRVLPASGQDVEPTFRKRVCTVQKGSFYVSLEASKHRLRRLVAQ